MKKADNKNAFTLIELLVVISIIALLALVSVVAFQKARAEARDAKRTHDIKILYEALEMYYDTYGNYPYGEKRADTSMGASQLPADPYPSGSYWGNDSDLQELVSEGLMQKLPIDPLNSGSYYYAYEPYDDQCVCIIGF